MCFQTQPKNVAAADLDYCVRIVDVIRGTDMFVDVYVRSFNAQGVASTGVDRSSLPERISELMYVSDIFASYAVVRRNLRRTNRNV